jgi:hypothetical protein
MSLSVSQILSETFNAVKSRFWALVGMWLVFFAIVIGMFVLFFLFVGGGALAMAGSMENPDAIGAGFGAGMIALMIVFYVAYLMLISAQYAALTALASPLRSADFGSAFGAGMRSAPTLLAVMVLFLIGYFVGALAIGALTAALSSLGTAGAAVSVLLFVIVLIYLACRLTLVFPVVPVDGVRNPITAIGRSWSLTRGNVLPIFLAMLVLIAITLVLVAILVAPVFGSLSDLGPTSTPPIGAMIFLFLGGAVLSVVLAVTYAAFWAALHARLAGREPLSETFE